MVCETFVGFVCVSAVYLAGVEIVLRGRPSHYLHCSSLLHALGVLCDISLQLQHLLHALGVLVLHIIAVAAPSVIILSAFWVFLMVATCGFRGRFRELQSARALPSTCCVGVPWTCVFFRLVVLLLLACGGSALSQHLVRRLCGLGGGTAWFQRPVS